MSDKKNEIENQLQLSLSYEDVTGQIAGRPFIQKDDRIKHATEVSYNVAIQHIQPRPGFNPRTVFEGIPELADSLLNDGQKEALKVMVLKDGRILFLEGDRRYRAFQLLLEQKRITPDHKIRIIPVTSNATEEQMLKDSWISNVDYYKHTFRPLEQAEVAWRFKHCFTEKERSDKEVADIMGCSRQTVNNFLSLAEAPDDIKNQLLSECITMTEALDMIRSLNKNKRAADKKEEASHIASAAPTGNPVDPLKEEMESLDHLDKQSEEYKLAEANRERINKERLLEVANEVECKKSVLVKHIGKRLAEHATVTTVEEVLMKDGSGELAPVEMISVVASKETELTEEIIDLLIERKVDFVFIYKKVTVAESVITEPPAIEKKSKFDTSREEIALCQNIIKNIDWISVHSEKVQPEQTSVDLVQRCNWVQKDMEILRDWVNKNKIHNKRAR